MFHHLIGNTPLVRLHKIEEAFHLKAALYGKIEGFNLTGSVKDRAAYQILMSASLKKDTVIIEPSSGNMGISLAAIGHSLGLKVLITMPENMSKERIQLMKLYGAEVVLTDSNTGMLGAIQRANELAKEYSSVFLPKQFENKDNVLAHYKTTGPEIYYALPTIDYFVAGIGTGGTITGTGQFLKEQNRAIQVVGVEPAASPFLLQNKTGKHQIQGIGAGFFPKILSLNTIDEILLCDDENAKVYTRALLNLEKIWAGISSGAACYAAVELAKRTENSGKKIVFLLPDHGSRYLSTNLFD